MSGPIDLVVLSRDAGPLRVDVREGIAAQRDVPVVVHRVVGAARPEDANRWATIARARNRAKGLGASPWLMFLDDDVVLEPGTIGRLLKALKERPGFAALAANYLEEGAARCGAASPGVAPHRHVVMGATLFRKATLAAVRFRWEPGKCECQCCCDDLRGRGMAIDYLPEARARHVARPGAGADTVSPPHARVLAAFDRRHLERFRHRFLTTLRGSGNHERVTAVGYGLYPSERRVLEQTPGVEVVSRAENGALPPVRRLRDFQAILARWPSETPVAYWDAADVIFQGELGPLWELVRAEPDRLLAVREPKAHPENTAVARWTLTIRDPAARRRAHALLTSRPFLNSGFAAGTAAAMLRYVREADRLLHSAELRGSSDWGDQTALNLYCHTDPARWHEAPETWNYCLLDRKPGEYRVLPEGRIVAPAREPIVVAHGHARSLRQFEIARRFV